jgi:hypothetical protein
MEEVWLWLERTSKVGGFWMLWYGVGNMRNFLSASFGVYSLFFGTFFRYASGKGASFRISSFLYEL